MEAKMDKLMDKCNKPLQFVGNFKRKLTRTQSLSTSTDLVRSCDDQDLDHLLENTDQDSEHQFNAWKQKHKSNGLSACQKDNNSLDGGDSLNNAEAKGGVSSSSSAPTIHKMPSSMIVLTEQEKAELKDVIMQMTLRECGL